MSQTCVVTGATGYIGSHLVAHLVEYGWTVHVIVRPESSRQLLETVADKIHCFIYDGNDVEGLAKYFAEIQPHVVFHVAAAVITKVNPNQVSSLIRANVEFGTQLLETMRLSGVSLIVSTGTYWQNYDSIDYRAVDLYAATKEAYEKILGYYTDAFSIRAITLRLFDVYGEDDKRPKLLNLLRNIAGTDQSIDVSPGGQLLDMVYISDVCRAYLAAYDLLRNNTTVKNEIYGVQTLHRTSLRDMVALFEDILGKSINVNWGARSYKEREIMRPMELYPSLPNWKAEVTLEEGLKRFHPLFLGG